MVFSVVKYPVNNQNETKEMQRERIYISAYHPKMGGHVMAKANVHTIKIITSASRLDRRLLE